MWDARNRLRVPLRALGQLHYVLLDEIQEVSGFEKVVNSLRARGDVSVFVTGSNAHLLGGDLATYLAGRYVEIRVWPLSFAEALQIQGVDAAAATGALLVDYLGWGGLPFRFSVSDDVRRAYLRDVFNSVVLRDVVQRVGVRDVTGLETVIDAAIENLGRTLSPTAISAYLKAQRRTLSVDAIYRYLRALDGALLLNRVRRFDIRARHVMGTLDTYYATDPGLMLARRVGQGPGRGDLMENCVFGELARRGFEVYSGVTPRGEVDFVAVKDGTPRYVQVAYLIPDDAVAAREFGAFDVIRDAYPRFVVSLDPVTQDRLGVRHLNLLQYLLAPPPELQ